MIPTEIFVRAGCRHIHTLLAGRTLGDKLRKCQQLLQYIIIFNSDELKQKSLIACQALGGGGYYREKCFFCLGI